MSRVIKITLADDQYEKFQNAFHEITKITGIKTQADFARWALLWTVYGLLRDDVGDDVKDTYHGFYTY